MTSASVGRAGPGAVQRWGRCLLATVVLSGLPGLLGCVTVAEFRKLERDVRSMQRGGGGGSASQREQMADLIAQVDSLQGQVEVLQGRLDVAERNSERALKEAQGARREANQPSIVGPETEPTAEPELTEEEEAQVDSGDVTATEISAYRAAYGAWRNGEPEACIDQFRDFLQTYPSSPFADDAAFWMADCYFKQGDFKTAILRFDDVVSRYPAGNKAADALYRQGEALLRLGPGYAKAAGKAFERVIREYPDTDRAAAAKRQLEVLGSG